MVINEIIKGKRILVCDICGDEIPIKNSEDNLNITIRTGWCQTFGFTHFDICKKHRKIFIKLIKKLKNEN